MVNLIFTVRHLDPVGGKSDIYSSSFRPDRFGTVDPFDGEFLKNCAMARSAKSRKMK